MSAKETLHALFKFRKFEQVRGDYGIAGRRSPRRPQFSAVCTDSLARSPVDGQPCQHSWTGPDQKNQVPKQTGEHRRQIPDQLPEFP